MSEGNAGHVWRTRTPIWTTNLVRDMCLPRSLEAREAGLVGGIWFAVKTDEAVYGVIELLGRQVAHPSEALMVEIEHLGIQLGRLFEAAHYRIHSDSGSRTDESKPQVASSAFATRSHLDELGSA
jgi:hypothetical protein